jgi:hypothetical protein
MRSALTLRCESQTLKSEGMIDVDRRGFGVVDEPPARDDPLNALPSQ